MKVLNRPQIYSKGKSGKTIPAPFIFSNIMKFFYAITIISTSLVISAEPLDLKKVSEDSNWIIHVDFESVRNSEIGIFIEDAFENITEIQNKVLKVHEKYGINMMKTSSFTMFGTGERHKGIGILEGGVNAELVSDFAKSKDSIEALKVGRNTIFSIQKGRRPMAFTALENGKMIFGPDRNYVSDGIFFANGLGKGIELHPLHESLSGLLVDPGFLFFANVKNVLEVVELNEWGRSMADKIDSCGMVIGDENGELKLVALLKTTSEEVSEPMENMVRGGLAMMEMKAGKNGGTKQFLNGYQVTRSGKIIRVEVEISNSFLIDRIKKGIKKSA